MSDVGSTGYRLTTVMAIDVCRYTALSEANEKAAIRLVRETERVLKQCARAENGRMFNSAGDGFLIEFNSVISGVSASLAFLKVARQSPELCEYAFRIGIHTGEVIEQDNGDLLGHAVNLACRLQSVGEVNTITTSEFVAEICKQKSFGEVMFRKRVALKNIKDRIKVYNIYAKNERLLFKRLSTFFGRQVRTIMASAVLIGISFFLIFSMRLYEKEMTIRAAIDTLDFSEWGLDTQIREIDTEHLRVLLLRLSNSGLPSDKAALSLLAAGDVTLAIKQLEESSYAEHASEEEYINTLRMIGLLSYYDDPRKAIATYKTLQRMRPNDAQTTYWLGRSYAMIDNTGLANENYREALKMGGISERNAIYLTINLAFSELQKGNFEGANALLLEIEPMVRELDDPIILARLQLEYGLVWERLGRFPESEAILLIAIPTLQNHGYLQQVARAYNVLGLINLQRAEQDQAASESHWESALGHFKNQLEIDRRLEKLSGQSEALYYIGTVQTLTGALDAAELSIQQSLRLATEAEVVNIHFLNLLALADLARLKNDTTESCRLAAEAKSFFDASISSNIGPMTRRKIERLQCELEF